MMRMSIVESSTRTGRAVRSGPPPSLARAASAILRLALLACLCTNASSFLFRSSSRAAATRSPTSLLRAQQRRSSLMQVVVPEAPAPDLTAVNQELCSAYSPLPDAPPSVMGSSQHRAPSFLIVGAQKAGTTFLHSLLSKVPGVAAPVSQPAFADGRASLPPIYNGITKELHFFDRANLGPTAFEDEYLPAWGNLSTADGGAMMFESTPGYLPTPMAPARIKALMPNAKIVITLREPTSRALSHWNMRQTFCQNKSKRVRCPLNFEDAVEREIRALDAARCRLHALDLSANAWNRCFRCYFEAGCDFTEGLDTADWFRRTVDPAGPREECGRWSEHAGYVFRGMYAAQISWWLQFFPASQLHVINQDDLEASPVPVLRGLSEFLGLGLSDDFIEALTARKGTGHFRGSYGKNSQLGDDQASSSIVRGLQRLRVFYAAHNANLYRLLQRLGAEGFSRFNVTKSRRKFQQSMPQQQPSALKDEA